MDEIPSDNLTTTTDTVVCSFYDTSQSLVIECEVSVPTGLQARMVGTRNACQDLARSKRFTYFALAAPPQHDQHRWLVFKMEGTKATFVKDWPNQTAAEMWMQHNG